MAKKFKEQKGVEILSEQLPLIEDEEAKGAFYLLFKMFSSHEFSIDVLPEMH